MREVDLWVAGAAVRQSRHWRQEGFAMPISINVSGATLTSPEHCSRLMLLLAQARGRSAWRSRRKKWWATWRRSAAP